MQVLRDFPIFTYTSQDWELIWELKISFSYI